VTPSARGGPSQVTPTLLRGWPLPSPAGTKDDKGRLLIVGGSTSTPGAVLLAAEAALRVGAGKVQVATTQATATQLAVALPECLVVGLDTSLGEIAPSAANRLVELAAGSDAVLAGPGAGDPASACALLEGLLPQLDTALVVDALGTAYVTEHPDGLQHLQGRVVLTPNASELARMLDEAGDVVTGDPLGTASRLAGRTGATVLSGADTSFVVEPTGVAWRIDAGAPGAAVAGSGDVKAGAVAGLLARGASPAQAAVWGSHLHGRAGERLTSAVGRSGFLARELASQLPRALGEVEA
jgi:hydroxyethylthiazole kinase-like uncharacterized protein yjeF